MNNTTKREIEEQAIIAFSLASDNGYISLYSSASEIEDNAYEILELMPDYDVADLTDEEYDYAVDILLSQVA